MSHLDAFLAPKFVIKRGTGEHDRLVQHITECFEAMQHATVIITQGTDPLRAVGVTDPTLDKPQGDLTVARLGAVSLPARVDMALELLSDPAVDVAGYLLMVAGRAIGNYLLAESLDGDGALVVRFANDFDVEVRRGKIDDKLATFEVIAFGSVARHAVLAKGESV